MLQTKRFRIIMFSILFVTIILSVFFLYKNYQNLEAITSRETSVNSLLNRAYDYTSNQGTLDYDSQKDIDYSYKANYHILPLDLTDQEAIDYLNIEEAKHQVQSTKEILQTTFDEDKGLGVKKVSCTYNIKYVSLSSFYNFLDDIHAKEDRIDASDFSLTYDKDDGYTIIVTYDFYFYDSAKWDLSDQGA